MSIKINYFAFYVLESVFSVKISVHNLCVMRFTTFCVHEITSGGETRNLCPRKFVFGRFMQIKIIQYALPVLTVTSPNPLLQIE